MKSSTSFRSFLAFTSLFLAGLISSSCETEGAVNGTAGASDRNIPKAEVLRDSISPLEKAKPDETKPEPKPVRTYRLDSISSSEELDNFLTRFTEKEKKVIFALNRMDPHRLVPGSQIVLPDTVGTDLMVYTPFPNRMEILDTIPRTVLIAQRIQGIALYENGRLIRWGPISSGKQSTPTPNGLFYGNHKSKRKVSTVNSSWIMPYYFNYMNFEGVGVHQYSMPGYPASHACVRLLEEDAKFIYEWADQWKLSPNGQEVIRNGTPFMVFGEYDFKSLPPWQRLAEDHQGNFLTAAEKDTIRDYVQRYLKDERNFESFPDKEEHSQLTRENLKTFQ